MPSEYKHVWRSLSDELNDPNCFQRTQPIASFGIKFLDQALTGIFPADVILIGAKTGVGKTEFVSSLARSIAQQGKRVNLVALEADVGEIGRRIFFKDFAAQIYSENRHHLLRKKLSFRDWELGKFDYLNIEIADREYYKNFFTSYRTDRGFSVEQLHDHLIMAGNAMDVVILDHVHYVDLDPEKENAELKKVIQTIREVAQKKQIPIIVVGHLRKSPGRERRLMPDIEDFHGSSDLGKIATRAILMAPCTSEEIREQSAVRFPTFIKIVKNRRDGSVARFCCLVDFDITTNSYAEDYVLGILSYDGSSFSPVTAQQRPEWYL